LKKNTKEKLERKAQGMTRQNIGKKRCARKQPDARSGVVKVPRIPTKKIGNPEKKGI